MGGVQSNLNENRLHPLVRPFWRRFGLALAVVLVGVALAAEPGLAQVPRESAAAALAKRHFDERQALAQKHASQEQSWAAPYAQKVGETLGTQQGFPAGARAELRELTERFERERAELDERQRGELQGLGLARARELPKLPATPEDPSARTRPTAPPAAPTQGSGAGWQPRRPSFRNSTPTPAGTPVVVDPGELPKELVFPGPAKPSPKNPSRKPRDLR